MLLFELLFEYDIKNLPPRFYGYKAFEIAYNKVLNQGLLTGTALPLEMVFSSMETKPDPHKHYKLLKSKTSYKFYVTPSQYKPKDNISDAFSGEGHDLLHLLTGNAPMNFATKADKFNKQKPSIKSVKEIIKNYGDQLGIDLLTWINKHLPSFYSGKTDDETIREELMSSHQTNGELFYKLLKFLQSISYQIKHSGNNISKAHFKNPSKTEYKEDWGVMQPGKETGDLPQYSAEEITGNSVLLNSAGDFESMGHLPRAIFSSKPITSKQLEVILRDFVYNMGKFYTREDSKDDPRIGPMMEKWKNYMLKLLPVFVKEYNQALKTLFSLVRSS
jgi:hypothetical protein